MISDRTSIFFIKSFNRLRNKAQIFSSLADDHYHTRLMHSLEVESISIEIAKKLIEIRKTDKFQQINFNKLSTIALLHDIGHTPFGHVGERTLHKICSGQLKNPLFPDFKKLKVSCGFKHNINSGLLYKEYLLRNRIPIDEDDVDVIEGLMKHSGLFYEKDKKCDYGFEYVSAGLPKQISYDDNPSTVEALIVSLADEIAQICSDYCDLKNSGADVSDLEKAKAFENANPEILSEFVLRSKNYLVRVLIENFDDKSTYKTIMDGLFGRILEDFDNRRHNIIKSNEMISTHDSTKEKVVEKLFWYYFKNGLKRKEIVSDYFYRIKRLKCHIDVVNEIQELEIEKTKKYLDEVVSINISKRRSRKFSKKKKNSYKLLYRTYIRTIAVHISKMTDSYANHKIEKIMSSNNPT